MIGGMYPKQPGDATKQGVLHHKVEAPTIPV
jgi:hypothetical protein